ncbi:SigE family RNA polymerase sigma factor [Polymorphospora rubra]|uniref:DNA-directed RNA polymerase sigma-70 factor n=1 Tax=Polymorphospora rubra TaxID=338584 RepID=A0A810N7F9_9ACTN|nr:DNA-directed RNA polymerase sigma-70 factor [Polymorphospora rubra]
MPDSFEVFVRTSGPGLLRYATLLCGNAANAEDLLQEVLARAYPRWSRVSTDNPEAYLRRAMSNSVISWWRSPWSRRRVPYPGEMSEPEDAVARADDRQMILAALGSLPPRMRSVVVLRYWLGFSEQDTAAELGCSTGSVKSQASRGLQRLRAALQVDHVKTGNTRGEGWIG